MGAQKQELIALSAVLLCSFLDATFPFQVVFLLRWRILVYVSMGDPFQII
jgi:hypothetical protein